MLQPCFFMPVLPPDPAGAGVRAGGGVSGPGEGWGQVLQGTGGLAGCDPGGQSDTYSNSLFVLNCTELYCTDLY